MINFRFHIVSIIAVFLALGLGVLMGSAVVNGAIVDRLDREISDVRKESNNLRAANREANDALDRANQYANDSAAYSVDGRLPDVPVVLVAERGVDEGTVNDTATLLRAAGANVPATFWLEDKWKLDSDDDAAALREAVDLLGGDNSVRTRALDELAARLTEPGAVPIDPESPDVVTRLVEAGFVTVEGDNVDLATFPPGPARVVVVTGTDSTFAGTDVTLDTARAFVDVDAPTVAAEVFAQHSGSDAPARGAAVAPVRTDDDLATRVTTVDDLDLVAGRVATVLSLQDLVAGVVGHYGYGDGATSPLPPRPDGS
jgi:Copper transport outer membrane protein, MctB